MEMGSLLGNILKTILKNEQRSLNNADIDSVSCRVLLGRPVLEGPAAQHALLQIMDVDNPNPKV